MIAFISNSQSDAQVLSRGGEEWNTRHDDTVPAKGEEVFLSGVGLQ